MAAHAELLAATLVLGAGIAVPLLGRRWPVWGRALWRVATLVVLTLLVRRIFGSPLRPTMAPGEPWEQAWQRLVAAGWWVAAARSVAGVARLALVLQNRSRETQILSDLIGAAIYVASAFAIVDVVLAVPIGGLVATSGIIAVVIGLALQSTLSDVFSGIAVDLERPYRAGDFLWVEGGIEGIVREVNWRSTHIATGTGDIAVVPNSVIAKARLINHSLPVPVRSASVEVRLDARVDPARALAALEAAVCACRLPLPSPAPGVALTALRGDGAAYEISFAVASSAVLGAARTELFTAVHRHLFHAGIPLAVDGVAEVPVPPVPTLADLLARSDLFGALDPEERGLLADRMVEVRLSPGDTLFRQGEAAEALVLVASGTAGILRRVGGAEDLVYRLGPGGSLGAIGLITGEPYAATATALTRLTAFRLDGAAIAAAIGARPALKDGLEDLARRGQAAISADIAALEDHGGEQPELFLSRMRAFVQRLMADAARGR